MKKSHSTILSIFVAFALVGSLYTVTGSAMAQTTGNTAASFTNNTEAAAPQSTNAGNFTTSFDNSTLANTNNLTAASTNNTGTATQESPNSGNATNAQASHGVTVTRDSQTILLEGHSLPEGSFIHLYDSTPFKITNGHIAAKLPCNDANQSSVNVLIGQAPNFKPAELEFVAPLSTSGDLCLYHADLAPAATDTITDIAIQNNSTDDIDFPATSTVVIGINEIAPLSGHTHNE